MNWTNAKGLVPTLMVALPLCGMAAACAQAAAPVLQRSSGGNECPRHCGTGRAKIRQHANSHQGLCRGA